MPSANSSATAAMGPQHAPYPPTAAGLGGTPSTSLDDPIVSVFLTLFIVAAITHMSILQFNMRRGRKFIISGPIFGFCMARITACTMRLVWSTHLTNISIAIAAQIFVQAGVLILFIVNLVFAQRILRACHPEFTWAKWFSLAFKLYYVSIVLMLAALITCTVQSFYTLSHNTRRIDRIVQLVGATYFAVAAFLPIPLLILNYLLQRKTKVEKFGTGRFRSKVLFLLFTSVLLSLGAAFRAGIAYIPRPRADPAWYDSKACFYIFNFSIEIIVVYLYAIIRVDKRFHVPNGSKRPGDYSGVNKGQEGIDRVNGFASRVLDDEEVFDGEAPEDERQSEASGPDADVEKNLAPQSDGLIPNDKRVSNTLTLGGNILPGTPMIEKSEDEIKAGYHPDNKRTSKVINLGGNALGGKTPYSDEIDAGHMPDSKRISKAVTLFGSAGNTPHAEKSEAEIEAGFMPKSQGASMAFPQNEVEPGLMSVSEGQEEKRDEKK